MHLELYAIGKLKDPALNNLIQEYRKRSIPLGKKVGFKSFQVTEFETKKNLSNDALKAYEAELLLKNSPDILIALDETGENLDSQSFAKLLENYKDNNYASCRFIIGGAYGLCSSVHKKIHKKISFGKCTWPHMMVRLMLCEQIYRSFTIINNHPYNK